jgi:hypothetical protein
MRTIGQRLPRFRREREEIRAFQLTPRDLEIIRQVARHRFLSSRHICALVPGASAQILRRLQILYHSGYLDRPKCQLDFYHRARTRPMVYGLGSRGAGTLRQKFDLPFARMDWDTKNKNAGRIFLDHALMIAEILIAFELGCRASGSHVKFIPASEIVDEFSTTGMTHEQLHRWRTSLGGKQMSVIPDGVFMLEDATAPAEKNRRLCFVEADRGTMPLVRARSTASCVESKLRLYANLWKQGQFLKKLNVNRVQVFIITESAGRVSNMLSAFNNLSAGRGLFHFGDVDSLKDGGSALEYPWHHLGGQEDK